MIKRHGILTALVMIAAAVTIAAQSRRIPDEENTIALFKRARAAVVHIKVSFQEGRERNQRTSSESVGSGFVIDCQGHILTNYHVVDQSNRIEVYLPGGRVAVAKLVGTAPSLDIALLQADLNDDDRVEPLRLGDSDALEVGQKLIVVGNPMALQNSLSVGVLSALGRTFPEAPIDLQGSLIQTDAAMNPGNSGGPILDSGGFVIGLVRGRTLEGQNLGFAIPINLVKEVLQDLIQIGYPHRPALGIDVVEITPQLADLFGIPVRSGFLIQDVFTGSPAHDAGLRAGDRTIVLGENTYVLGGDAITAINGKAISSLPQLRRELLAARPPQQLRLTIFRDGQSAEVILPFDATHGPSK